MNHIIYDGNSLYEAFKASQKTSSWKPQVQFFAMDFLHQLNMLQKELKSRSYKTSRKTEFILRERGKVRHIHGAQFRDRIVRHSICDNVLNPALEPKLIYDNCASRKGRGVTMSRERLKVHLQKYYRQHKTNEGYILLMDFSGYYDNLRHGLLLESIRKYIKDEYTLWLLNLILDDFKQDVSYLPDGKIKELYYGKFKSLEFAHVNKQLKTGRKFLRKSVDIGDQCSQILGIYYPTPIDNYIKIVRGEKYYARYMDDSYIISPSREHLIELLHEIKRIADTLGIILNDKKVRIVKISKTFTYLQNKYFVTETGKVVVRINPKRVCAMRCKLKKLHKKMLVGEITCKCVAEMFNSWKHDYYRIMSKAQRHNMDNLYRQLFKEME